MAQKILGLDNVKITIYEKSQKHNTKYLVDTFYSFAIHPEPYQMTTVYYNRTRILDDDLLLHDFRTNGYIIAKPDLEGIDL